MSFAQSPRVLDAAEVAALDAQQRRAHAGGQGQRDRSARAASADAGSTRSSGSSANSSEPRASASRRCHGVFTVGPVARQALLVLKLFGQPGRPVVAARSPSGTWHRRSTRRHQRCRSEPNSLRRRLWFSYSTTGKVGSGSVFTGRGASRARPKRPSQILGMTSNCPVPTPEEFLELPCCILRQSSCNLPRFGIAFGRKPAWVLSFGTACHAGGRGFEPRPLRQKH